MQNTQKSKEKQVKYSILLYMFERTLCESEKKADHYIF